MDTVAIVTGGAHGPGREIARALAGRDFAVAVVYLRDQGGAEGAIADIVAAGGTAVAVRADVTDELDVERLFDETAAAYGSVDVVVHGAVCGIAVVNRQAARRLRPGGAIVAVSTAEPIPPELAERLRARDITVNGVAPGVEPPGAGHTVTELVALLEHWRGMNDQGGTDGDPGPAELQPRDRAHPRAVDDPAQLGALDRSL